MKIFNHMTLQIFTVLKQRGPFLQNLQDIALQTLKGIMKIN